MVTKLQQSFVSTNATYPFKFCFSETMFVDEVSHLFLKTNSEETVRQRLTDAVIGDKPPPPKKHQNATNWGYVENKKVLYKMKRAVNLRTNVRTGKYPMASIFCDNNITDRGQVREQGDRKSTTFFFSSWFPFFSDHLTFTPFQFSPSLFFCFLFVSFSLAFVPASLICMYCQPVSPFYPPGALSQLCG